jgi:hypothetical protein
MSNLVKALEDVPQLREYFYNEFVKELQKEIADLRETIRRRSLREIILADEVSSLQSQIDTIDAKKIKEIKKINHSEYGEVTRQKDEKHLQNGTCYDRGRGQCDYPFCNRGVDLHYSPTECICYHTCVQLECDTCNAIICEYHVIKDSDDAIECDMCYNRSWKQ